jgi:hypothetical protein
LEQTPAPLVSPEISMGANDFFPFYFDRLRRSKWWRRASDVARARNVMMWGEAYKSTPAGSLADDDDDLAEAAGYGMDVPAFLQHKAEIMAPWVMCADGRWYHPVVCEVVLETWERTSEKRRQDRARQAARRDRIKTHTQGPPAAPLSAVTHDAEPVTRDNATSERESAPQDKTGHDTNSPVASASPLATAKGAVIVTSQPDPEPWKRDAEFMGVWDACTQQMRRRAKSMRKAWAEWVKVRKGLKPGHVLAGMRGYLKDDPDVKRTGGPGLQIWLRDRTFELWAGEAIDPLAAWTPERWAVALDLWKTEGKWGETLGPAPDQPGCKVPDAALSAAAIAKVPALRVVQGGAA